MSFIIKSLPGQPTEITLGMTRTKIQCTLKPDLMLVEIIDELNPDVKLKLVLADTGDFIAWRLIQDTIAAIRAEDGEPGKGDADAARSGEVGERG